MNGIVVLGCYRSGSSAVAGALHHLGVFMGEKFDPPTPANPKGFFEDVEFKDLHKRLMDEEDIYEEYRELVEKRSRLPIWGLKDPRLCLLMSRLPLDPSLVIALHRPVAEIIRSLRKAVSADVGWDILVEHYLKKRDDWLLRYPGPIMDVRFDDLTLNPHRTVQTIANFVSLPFREEAVNFISRS